MAEESQKTAQELAALKAEVDRLTRALDEANARAGAQDAPGDTEKSPFETAEEIGERVQEGLGDLQKRIDENPVPSALIAFAIGFLLGRVFTR